MKCAAITLTYRLQKCILRWLTTTTIKRKSTQKSKVNLPRSALHKLRQNYRHFN